jgi:hypothetical protein
MTEENNPDDYYFAVYKKTLDSLKTLEKDGNTYLSIDLFKQLNKIATIEEECVVFKRVVVEFLEQYSPTLSCVEIELVAAAVSETHARLVKDGSAYRQYVDYDVENTLTMARTSIVVILKPKSEVQINCYLIGMRYSTETKLFESELTEKVFEFRTNGGTYSIARFSRK